MDKTSLAEELTNYFVICDLLESASSLSVHIKGHREPEQQSHVGTTSAQSTARG